MYASLTKTAKKRPQIHQKKIAEKRLRESPKRKNESGIKNI
jgi:hypothetical protein